MTQSLLYHGLKSLFYSFHMNSVAAILAFIIAGLIYRHFTSNTKGNRHGSK